MPRLVPARFLLLLLLPAASLVGCRDPLCVRTLVAECACDDPLQPLLDHCTASYEVVSCEPVDAAVVDPCRLAPCCRAPSDGGARPPDLALSSSDGL